MATSQQTRLPARISQQQFNEILARESVQGTFRGIASRYLDARQIETQFKIAIALDPSLLECDPASVLEAGIQVAALGLRFAGAGNEAFLVKYGNRCQLIIGYRGLLALARRTGKVKRIEARVVHEKDRFEVSYGSGQQIVHKPCLEADRGPIIGVYALAELTDGSLQIETMTRVEIDAIKARSRAGDKGPWTSDYAEMARKTAIRRIAKYLPFEDPLLPPDLDETDADEDEPPRRPIDSTQLPDENDVPDGVDAETGEILDGDTDDVTAFDEPEEPAEAPDTSLSGLKKTLVGHIKAELEIACPGDSPAAQAARLAKLKYLFGQVQWKQIANLPNAVLAAGLDRLKRGSEEIE